MTIQDLIPLLAAVIGLTPVILKWISDRSVAAAKRRKIQHAKEQVEFWRLWLQAQNEVSSEERFIRLQADIAERLDKLVAEQDTLQHPAAERATGPNALQRALLAFLPSTTTGWVSHTLFYIVVSLAALLTLGASLQPETLAPSWEQLRRELGFLIPVLIFFAAVGLLLQRIANKAEDRYRAEQKAQSSDQTPV